MKLIRLEKTVKLITFILGMLSAGLCYSIEVNDLYQSEVMVVSQSTSERNNALKQAMAAVIVKVGGQEEALNHNVIRSALTQYNTFITQFHYDRKINSLGHETNEQLYLVAAFNEDKINQLFQRAGLPIWGRLRPQVLVWVIEENGLQRSIVSDTSSTFIPNTVKTFSQQRGLPMNMPLMDLDDAHSINISDLWGRFAEPTRQASSRYMPDAILIIRISNSSLLGTVIEDDDDLACTLVVCTTQNEYLLDWSLVSQGQVFSDAYQGADKKALFNTILIDVSNNIYQRYALNTELNNDVVIDVANIDSLARFVSLMDFIENLASVESATLVGVQGSNRRIQLKLRGSKQALFDSLALNKLLAQYIDPLAANSADDVPVFYWEPK